MKISIQQDQPGDYYGVVYKGNFVLPLLLAIGLGVVFWLLFRKRNK